MPKYGPHLKDIEEKVHGKVAELGLKPGFVFDAKKHQERFYTTVCKDKTGNKVVFKMRTEDFEETKEYFCREIKINQLFTKCYSQSGNLSVPKFIEGDADHAPEWMVYEFIEGYETGDFYNGFEKTNIKNFSVESFLQGIKNMHEMSAFADGDIKLKTEEYVDVCKAYEDYRERLRPFFTDDEIQKAADIIESGKNVLDGKNKVIAHGDFHPGNVIITKKKGIAIIDWYCVHLNNPAFDIAFFCLEITDDKFRKEILEKYVKELVEDEVLFWQLFRLNVLRLAPYKVNVLCDALYTINPTKEDYYAKLTRKGIDKLETNLHFFEKALSGINFL